MLTTDHSHSDSDMIRVKASLVIDSRGIYRTPASNVLKV